MLAFWSYSDLFAKKSTILARPICVLVDMLAEKVKQSACKLVKTYKNNFSDLKKDENQNVTYIKIVNK